MVSTLLSSIEQTLLLLFGKDLQSKVTYSARWQTLKIQTPEQLKDCVENAWNSSKRVILLIEEAEYKNHQQFLLAKENRLLNLPMVVITSTPFEWLKTHHHNLQILDCCTLKELRKESDGLLTRWVRSIIHGEEKNLKFWNQKTLEKLNSIFIELSSERKPENLIASILLKATDLVQAEAGLLYLLEEVDGELIFKLRVTQKSQNQVELAPLTLKVSENSLCGYVALTGKTVNLSDPIQEKANSVPQYQRPVDLTVEGSLKSLLTVPFKNTRNETIAILQLGNKKTEAGYYDFEPEEESLLKSFSTQASICLENVDLYADIQRLFEGFVKASITAIEARDPSTGGHSERVAKICVALAEATSDVSSGVYRSVRFKPEELRELEYAALLHDFGKIGVREEVLVKAKKLHSWQLESIRERIKICKAAIKIAYLEQKITNEADKVQLEKEYSNRIQRMDEFWNLILAANEPTVLRKESAIALSALKKEQLLLPDGSFINLLSEEEYQALSVTQGSLTENERLEVESHVRHTFQFLKMIPWTKDFRNLPEIAFGHHEKLDGSGYPRGLVAHEIPLQSKIMTIADIYDALTAADRWYKEAVPVEKALDILAAEVNQGKLDPVLFELFVEKKIYQITFLKSGKVA